MGKRCMYKKIKLLIVILNILMTFLTFIKDICFSEELSLRKEPKLFWYSNLISGDIGLMQPQTNELPYIAEWEFLNFTVIFQKMKIGAGITLGKTYYGVKEDDNNNLIRIITMHASTIYLNYYPNLKYSTQSKTYLEKTNNYLYIGTELREGIKIDFGYSLEFLKYFKIKIGYISFSGRLSKGIISNHFYCTVGSFIKTGNILENIYE